MRELEYMLLDVFTSVPFGGNPLAVFPAVSEVSDEEMQMIARELNLSETVFVTPALANGIRRLRIFTPQTELPMAGHPTIGTAYALAQQNIIETEEGDTHFVLEEGVGDIPVTIRKQNGIIQEVWMEQPSPVFGSTMSNIELVSELLSIKMEDIDTSMPVQTVSAGVPFLYIPVKSVAAMKKIQLRMDVWEREFKGDPQRRHILVFTKEVVYPGSDVHCRMFAPAMGIPEDPATGAASGPLGCYLLKNGKADTGGALQFISEQGIEMKRPSFIKIAVSEKEGIIVKVAIAGTAVLVGKGTMYLP